MDKLNKDELFSIAIELNLPELLNFCSSSKRINEFICKRNDVWNYKLKRDFDKYIDEIKGTPREKYTFLYSLKSLVSPRSFHYIVTTLELYKPDYMHYKPYYLDVISDLERIYTTMKKYISQKTFGVAEEEALKKYKSSLRLTLLKEAVGDMYTEYRDEGMLYQLKDKYLDVSNYLYGAAL